MGAVECIYRVTLPREKVERGEYTGVKIGFTWVAEKKSSDSRTCISKVAEQEVK